MYLQPFRDEESPRGRGVRAQNQPTLLTSRPSLTSVSHFLMSTDLDALAVAKFKQYLTIRTVHVRPGAKPKGARACFSPDSDVLRVRVFVRPSAHAGL